MKHFQFSIFNSPLMHYFRGPMRKLLCLFLIISTFAVAQTKKNITLEDIWLKGTFSSKSFSGFNFMKDGMYYTEVKDNALLKKEVKTGNTVATLINDGDLMSDTMKLKLGEFEFSNDESKIILKTESENIYRRSARSIAYAYDLKSKKLWKISPEKILHATFNPQATMVAYVKTDNNLYVYDLLTSTERAITTDGLKNSIINGNCDWVYEEEFEFSRAFQWNKTGDYIAYYKFDERNVPEYSFVNYGQLYPQNYTYKYPKAGEDNSFVSIWSYNIMTSENKRLFSSKDYQEYIPRIKFTADAKTLCIFSLNRHQDNLKLYFMDIEKGGPFVRYAEKNYAYIEINDNLTFLNDGKSMVYSSEKDGWNHLYIRAIETGVETCLTPGNYDIEELKGVDEKNKLVYYTAAVETHTEREFYSVNFQGEKRMKITKGNGMHRIALNSNYTLLTDNFSTANTPVVSSLCDMKGNVIRVLENNKALKDTMLGYDIAKVEFTKINDLNAWIIKPSNFDPGKKYPVLMYVYGGPNSQTVTDGWMGANYLWYQLLAQKGYIIISVDNTGTGYRGEAFRKKTYLQLGKYESDDQIAAAKTIASWNFVDASRIGIWGWSYGGFMSSTCITKGADVFKTAIAVAPVTNWRYYDNIYTERYMRTPAENAAGYDDNSPVNMVSKLKGNYLLIHGTADDNVHFQNSVMMIDAMIKQAKVFDSEIYPNKNHGISGGKTRYQLYNKMTTFILEKL
jgi:dipeptidyl-peptidase-4